MDFEARWRWLRVGRIGCDSVMVSVSYLATDGRIDANGLYTAGGMGREACPSK